VNPDCQYVHDRLAAYLERDLPLPERARVEAHLAACGPCRDAARVTGAMVEAMGTVAGPALPEGFAHDLRARLETVDAPRTRRLGPLAGLAGIAAVLAVALAFLLTGPGHESGPGPAAGAPMQVALGGDAVAEIRFDSAEPIEGVRFTLELPAGVRVVQNGRAVAVSTLTWEGSLAAGTNVIHLPLRGVVRGTWTVTAKVAKDGSERARTVGLVVDGA